MYEEICKGNYAYQRFSTSLKYENRFFLEKEFIDIFDVIIAECECNISQNTKLYRARIYNNEKKKDEKTKKIFGKEIPFIDENIGMPPSNKILSNGRINSKGVNFFYLAADKETVIAESKPNIDSYVTIGTFETKKNLKVIKISPDMSNGINNRNSNKQGRFSRAYIKAFLNNLQIDFSCPISDNDKDINYLPMQYFSQYCKYKHYDGIIYPSSVMEQYEKAKHYYNYTFFKDTHIRWVDSELVRIRKIRYTTIPVITKK